MDRLASFGSDPFDKPPCRGCSSYLTEPYIKCAECGPTPFLLCLQCFTKGFEYKKHESNHKYEIMTSDFPVLDPGWTAQEEMQDVAYQMRSKSREESTDDPPRPTFDSVLSRDMAGYMPARADFMEEFDNYAEWDLKDIEFVDDDSDVLHSLKVAVVDIYHSRLKERQRRKKIIRDHGLINLRKFQMLERCYPKEVQELYEVMRRFARVVGPTEHDKFIEGHALEFELRREIRRLQDYRKAGIKSFCSAKVYDRVSHVREEERRKRSMLCDVLHFIQDGRACQQWLSKQAAIDSGITPVATTITLCQMVRLVPGAYLEYKQALLSECRRQGGLRLAQARSLIKIDVNKTRKIYDFLIKEGCINKA
ncbi:hypothetical protein CRUP_030660 [Coryphaenoides rupestris]|nr:hypothetical protein CRUP_030660 [Coryphaenoides rupestris]